MNKNMNLQEIIKKLEGHFKSLATKYPSDIDVGTIGAVVLVELRNMDAANQNALEKIFCLCRDNESSVELVGKIEKIAEEAIKI